MLGATGQNEKAPARGLYEKVELCLGAVILRRRDYHPTKLTCEKPESFFD